MLVAVRRRRTLALVTHVHPTPIRGPHLLLSSHWQPPFTRIAAGFGDAGLTKLPGLLSVVLLAEDPQVVHLPTTALGDRDNVVHLQVGSLSAHLAGEPVPGENLGLDRRPIPRPALVPGRCVLPGPPGLVLSAPTIPEGRLGAACHQANALGSWHCTPLTSSAPAGYCSGSRGQPPSWISFQLRTWRQGGAFRGLRHLLNREINRKETI